MMNSDSGWTLHLKGVLFYNYCRYPILKKSVMSVTIIIKVYNNHLKVNIWFDLITMKMLIYYLTIQERFNFYLVQRSIKVTDYLDLSGQGVVIFFFFFPIVKRLPNTTFVQSFHLINYTVRAKVIFHFIVFLFT